MAKQIGKRSNGQCLRTLVSHCERIAVVETKRHSGAQPHFRQAAIDAAQVERAVDLEDFPCDGAVVLRIQVYRPRLESRKNDAGIAEPRAVYRIASLPREQLAQDVG